MNPVRSLHQRCGSSNTCSQNGLVLGFTSNGVKVVNSLQMQEIDRKSISDYGIKSLDLMENAGRKVGKVAMKMAREGSSICVCCGGGNNGGDGLVVARYLAKKNYKIRAFLFSEKLSKDTSANLEIIKKRKISFAPIYNEHALKQYKETIFSCDLIIDALTGTGLKGEAKGFLKDAISFLNHTGLPILSVDCPSGLTSDINLSSENCIRAFATVTLALPKIDLLIYPGREFVGNLYIADIGIPKQLLDFYEEKIKTELIDKNLIISWLNIPRKPDSHKGDFGHVFILAGSRNASGASVLASKGALRSGAGLVTLGVPESIHPIVATKLTEAMTLSLPETKEGSLSLKAEEKILKFISDKADVVVIGPGISLNKETGKLIRKLLVKIKKPVLIDADGITHLSGNINILKSRKDITVITPHPGEMSRLVASSSREINKKRVEAARDFSLKHKIYTILKGASTVIGTPTGEVFINITGNPAMSSGGMGDVLSGLISGYMAQKFSAKQAIIMGVYIHGLAADYLETKMGERGILAGELADIIPLVSKKLIKTNLSANQQAELTDKVFLI